MTSWKLGGSRYFILLEVGAARPVFDYHILCIGRDIERIRVSLLYRSIIKEVPLSSIQLAIRELNCSLGRRSRNNIVYSALTCSGNGSQFHLIDIAFLPIAIIASLILIELRLQECWWKDGLIRHVCEVVVVVR